MPRKQVLQIRNSEKSGQNQRNVCFKKQCFNIQEQKIKAYYRFFVRYPIQMENHDFGKLFAGEVHYSRIPVEYWQHRIKMIKALGLNTLSVYIMWNYHEVERGVFDYKTGNKNLPLFLELAEKYEMKVLFRPGPYVCAEWDFGGLPARLLNVKDCVIRENNPVFLQESKIYFESLIPIMQKHTKTEQNPTGCIIMLQIENEYGFYGTDKSYMQAIRKIWFDLGVKLPHYYVDWPENIKKCHWQGANIGINNWIQEKDYELVRQFEKNGYLLGGEIYSGWMTHWTEKWGGKKLQKVISEYEYLCGYGRSFAMYMVHGGTNFGLTAGANGLKDKPSDYWGAITSYDYDAPINEQGAATPKYHALRALISKHIDWPLPDIPEPLPLIDLPPIPMKPKASLLNNLPKPIPHHKPLVFESSELQMYNQGIVMYTTKLQPHDYKLRLTIHDYGILYLKNKVVARVDRTKEKSTEVMLSKEMIEEFGTQLRIVCEASGHINFDHCMKSDFKGLCEVEGDQFENQWLMYPVAVDQAILGWKAEENVNNMDGVLFQGSFQVGVPGDTYLDMSQYGKGYVWVNGYNLGRYWSEVGPQTRYFCPGAWLKNYNVIHVLNLDGQGGAPIKGVKELYHTPIMYE